MATPHSFMPLVKRLDSGLDAGFENGEMREVELTWDATATPDPAHAARTGLSGRGVFRARLVRRVQRAKLAPSDADARSKMLGMWCSSLRWCC